jgi:hypothetical protein
LIIEIIISINAACVVLILRIDLEKTNTFAVNDWKSIGPLTD